MATRFLIVLALLAPLTVYGLSCSHQYECTSVSTDYNYVQCVNGACVCRESLGFNGTASVNDKCRCDYTVAWGTNGTPYCKVCDPPRSIFYENGTPYCARPSECESDVSEKAKQALRIEKVKKVYQNLVYPLPIAIIAGQYPITDLFASTVQGRVSPLGSFDDFTAVEEYFYGLGASSQIDYVVFKTLVASGDYVAIEVDLFFNYTLQGRPSHNLTQTGFYRFNSDDLIVSLDLDILNIGAVLDVYPTPEIQNATIINLCKTLVLTPGFCSNPATDPDGHYTDVDDCVEFFHSVPFGSWTRGNSNTVICRMLHTILTAFRPFEHCPHVGKTGGHKCVDMPYSDFYVKDF